MLRSLWITEGTGESSSRNYVFFYIFFYFQIFCDVRRKGVGLCPYMAYGRGLPIYGSLLPSTCFGVHKKSHTLLLTSGQQIINTNLFWPDPDSNPRSTDLEMSTLALQRKTPYVFGGWLSTVFLEGNTEPTKNTNIYIHVLLLVLTFIPLLQRFTWILQKVDQTYNVKSN